MTPRSEQVIAMPMATEKKSIEVSTLELLMLLDGDLDMAEEVPPAVPSKSIA